MYATLRDEPVMGICARFLDGKLFTVVRLLNLAIDDSLETFGTGVERAQISMRLAPKLGWIF